jgi:YidC/Oxa1 family membrane protein insertase
MDKNTIVGLILIFSIFIGFNIFNNSRRNNSFIKALAEAELSYSKGELETARNEYNNALNFKPNQSEVIEKLNELNAKLRIGSDSQKIEDKTTDSSKIKTPDQRLHTDGTSDDTGNSGIFSKAAKGINEFITLENNRLKLSISLRGGKVYSATLKDYKTFDAKPLILFNGDSTLFGFNFFTTENKLVQTNNLYFTSLSNQKSFIAGNQQQSVILRLISSDDKYIEYKYTLAPDSYMVDLDVNLKSMESLINSNQKSLTLEWKMYIPQQEKGRTNEESYSAIRFKNYQGDVDDSGFKQSKELVSKDIKTKLTWVAFQDQFFSSVLLTKDYFLNGSFTSEKTVSSKKYLRYYTSEVGIPYNSISTPAVAMKLFYGPNHFTTLKNEGYDLEKLVSLGKNIIGWINRYAIIPVFNWLNYSIKNYGLIILILTLIIKIALFPLTFKSYQSTAKMAVMKPIVEELGKKFPNKEDAMKKQQATMDLYKRAGVNPMGGCLPMLLQMPILFAMYRFFPVSIELRQEHFLWATDLSTYDSIFKLPFIIPVYGDHVSLFTLLMTASTFLTMKMTGSSSGSDQPGMKLMMYMSPVMIMFFLNNSSSGLTWYYFLANILTYAQNIISKRFINTDTVILTLEENKKKPVKKSSWQKNMESVSKQRGIHSTKNK